MWKKITAPFSNNVSTPSLRTDDNRAHDDDAKYQVLHDDFMGVQNQSRRSQKVKSSDDGGLFSSRQRNYTIHRKVSRILPSAGGTMMRIAVRDQRSGDTLPAAPVETGARKDDGSELPSEQLGEDGLQAKAKARAKEQEFRRQHSETCENLMKDVHEQHKIGTKFECEDRNLDSAKMAKLLFYHDEEPVHEHFAFQCNV